MPEGNSRFKIGDGTNAFTLLPYQDEAVRQLVDDLSQVVETKLTIPSGVSGQYLGFVEDNVVGAVNAPNTSSSPYNTVYNGTLSTSDGWETDSNGYYFQITLDGITDTQMPLVFPQWINKNVEQDSWSILTDIITYNGYIRLYASAIPTVAVNYTILYTTYGSDTVELVTNGEGIIGTFTPIYMQGG